MKNFILLLISLSIAVLLQAQVSKTVNVSAGGLSSALSASEKSTITNLTVTGTIDARDFKVMRDLITNLAVIDLENAVIVSYTGNQGTDLGYSGEYLSNEIPAEAFFDFSKSKGKTTLISIKFPVNVTKINKHAFDKCKSLTFVNLSNRLKIIDDGSFWGCDALKNINLPNSLEEIGDLVFYESGLESIVIPESLKKMGENVFSDCYDLKSFEFRAPLTKIEYRTFYNCVSLTTAIIPSTIKTIGSGAFMSCTRLTSVYIPSSVTTIGNNAFDFCLKLESISIPSSVTTFGYYVFYSCSEIKSVISENPVPVDLSSSPGVFAGVNSLQPCKLYVPHNSIAAYKAANQWKDFTIVEDLQTIGVTYTFGKLSSEGSVQSFDLACNGSWKIISDQSWLTTSTSSGTGNATISVTTTANNTTSDRQANIIILANACSPKLVTVIQSALQNTLAVSNNSLTIGAGQGSTATADVTSNTTWIAASDQSWLTINPNTSTKGNATLTFTASENTTVNTRIATVTLSGTGVESQTITVTQSAGNAILDVSSNTASVGKTSGSTTTVNVISNTSWIASRNETWLTVIPNTSTTGNATLTITASENTTINSRTAIVTLSATGVASKTITVTQAAGDAALMVSSDTVSVDKAAGSTTTVNVTSNTTWLATSNETWISVNPGTSATGNALITFTAEENPTVSSRTATVTVSATGVASQTITVIQAAGDATLMVSSNTVSVNYAVENSATVNISSNTTWTAASNETWLTVNPGTSTSGNATITFTAAENTTVSTRTATVTVSATGVANQTITVTQEAAPATLSISENTVSVAKEANSAASITMTSNTAWTASSNQSWLSINPASGTGNGTVVFSAEANQTSSERIATVTISAEGTESVTITVTQAGRVGNAMIKMDGITLFPNPVTNGFRLSGFEGSAELIITDLSGKVYLNKSINENEYIPGCCLTKGIYIVKISTFDNQIEKKMIKE
jgi:PKD repeat protein